jgi:ferric-dicitrate binding protein FerR (iron transport regulator)
MKEEINNNKAREKYLSRKPLNPKEKAFIDSELNSPEFTGFKQEDGQPLLLPETYSAESAYSLIDRRIVKNSRGQAAWKYWTAAASIALLIGLACFAVFYSKPVAQLTASTGYGETMEVILPDSSTVVLNALSSLSYPSRFAGKERLINLNGEGYFKVRKDVQKPFKVQTGGLSVEVLGTTFNVQSYDNEEIIETALFEGSVAVYSGESRQMLKPGETAYYNKVSSSFQIKQEDVSAVIQWQKGILLFDNIPLKEIFKTLERQYNVQLDWKDADLQQLKITARFTSDESIGDIIEILSGSAGFTYEKQGKKYRIGGKKSFDER